MDGFCIVKYTAPSALGLRGLLFLQVIHGKVEEVELPEKADILISEPMGESLAIIVRDERTFLKRIMSSIRTVDPSGEH